MNKLIDQYTYRVTWSLEDQEFVGCCLELPSLSWLEKSPEKALIGIRRLADECLKDMQSNGEPIPEPISSRHYSGRFVVRVPPDLHKELALQAAEAGVSLNRLISSRLSYTTHA